MPQPYQMILFDCVNTLVLPDSSRVPVLEVEGQPVRSTAPVLHQRLAGRFAHLDPVAIHNAHRQAWLWAESQRGGTHLEVHALRRFRHLFTLLGLPERDEALVREIVDLHMEIVTGSFMLPPGHADLLRELGQRFRLGILSNFDIGAPLLNRLRQHGIAELFDPIVISADIGFRKPGRAAFERTLELARATPEQVLYVGDSWDDDVRGAHGAGMDVAWINRDGRAPPQPADSAVSERPPTYTLADLTHLRSLLGPAAPRPAGTPE